jgi:hypothetical protein
MDHHEEGAENGVRIMVVLKKMETGRPESW